MVGTKIASPVRTCTGCRIKRPQAELVRVVRRPDGTVAVEGPSEDRGPGRGAYVCLDESCIERALRGGGFRRALRFEGPFPEGLGNELVLITKEKDG